MRLSISSKIILLLSVTIVFVLSIGFYLITLKESEEQFNEMRKDALAISRTIQVSAGKIMSDLQSDRDYIQTLTEHLGNIGGVEWVEVFDREATIIAHTDKERVGGKPLEIHELYVKEIFKNGKPIEEEDKQRSRYNRFVPVYDITKEGEEAVIGVVEVVLDMKLVFKKIATLRLRMILTVIVLIMVLLGLNLWFLRKIVVLPIRKLLDMTKKVAKGNLTQRLEITSHDELGKLGTSFNKMVEDLETTTTSIENLNKEITERKKMEAALLQTEKLRAMGVMTSGVAHDFNNILAIISGHTQILEGNFKEDKKLTDITRTIYKAAEDGAGIVRRMRQFTKMERDTSMFVSVNIKNVLEDAVGFLKPRWMNIAIAGRNPFDMDMDDIKEVPSILGNPSELREVFINIINNAIDAMPGGGRISFRTWSEKDTVFVRITDTGEGMSEEVKERIFDPFFTTKRAEGSGLGMSISYSIIKRHDGKIEVESEEGKGTAFNLSIPICKEAVQEIVSTEPDQEIATRKLSILVVDDESNLCVLLDGFLSRAGHDVKSITSGKEAIELIKSEEFDLVLSDLVMPGLSGYDVIQALDKLDKRPKVGLITGWKEEIENKDKEGLNVDFILRKPFDLTVLTKHINDVIDAG